MLPLAPVVVVYIYDCKIKNALMTAKSRLNIIKNETIPRLKLMAPFFFTKLVTSVVETFKIY